jgi:hypothetical protein
MPHKDLERRRAYQRDWQAKHRRACGALVKDDSTSINHQKPWEEYRISRAWWFRLYRWTDAERERWRHREQA